MTTDQGLIPQNFALLETLRLAVPLHIDEMRGLPTDTLLAAAQRAADIVGCHGDDLQFGGAHCAKAFNSLARGLAAAALTAQGGVTWRGLHWCQTPGCDDPDDIAAHVAACPSPPPAGVPPRDTTDLPDIATYQGES